MLGGGDTAEECRNWIPGAMEIITVNSAQLKDNRKLNGCLAPSMSVHSKLRAITGLRLERVRSTILF